MQFDLGCQLNYSLDGPSTLIFNIHAVQGDMQSVLSENLTLSPQLEAEFFTDDCEGNRYFRINAAAGPLEVAYRARVDSQPLLSNPADIPELTPDQLPLDALSYLYPSRYCQSDRLVRLALAQFGDMQPGYSRVTAICNWVYDNIEYQRGKSTC